MKTLKSISTDQFEIIENILKLHVPSGQIDFDGTFGRGNFYKNGRIQRPLICSDINDHSGPIDIRETPFLSDSVNTIMFDPPFVMGQGPSLKVKKKNQNIMANQFSLFKNPKELFEFYNAALKEQYRILKKNGILIFKCQDCVWSGKNVISHYAIIHMAYKIGFYPKDIAILEAKKRPISGKIKKQQHFRKFHSYFLVLQKKNPMIKYDELMGYIC